RRRHQLAVDESSPRPLALEVLLEDLDDAAPRQVARLEAEQRGGVEQIVALAGADQVEHEQIALAGIRPSAASDHLAVQRPRTRRAGDDDGLDARLVEAFPEDLAVSEHLRLAAGETLENGAALAEFEAAVDRLRGDAARAEGRGGLVGDGDAGHEDQA